MRLWHQKLIQHLPRQQLLGQHRECCALRGAGWGRKHSVVNYVFNYTPDHLVAYHYFIMDEMIKRGYKPDPIWRNVNWRGSTLGEQKNWCNEQFVSSLYNSVIIDNCKFYSEHNEEYLIECIENLRVKNIEITI